MKKHSFPLWISPILLAFALLSGACKDLTTPRNAVVSLGAALRAENVADFDGCLDGDAARKYGGAGGMQSLLHDLGGPVDQENLRDGAEVRIDRLGTGSRLTIHCVTIDRRLENRSWRTVAVAEVTCTRAEGVRECKISNITWVGTAGWNLSDGC